MFQRKEMNIMQCLRSQQPSQARILLSSYYYYDVCILFALLQGMLRYFIYFCWCWCYLHACNE